MRHFVNHALLLFFLVLAGSGILSFFEPFKLLTTRIHIVFGFGLVVLVLLHVVDRLRYFKKSFASKNKAALPSRHFSAAAGLCAFLLLSSVFNCQPVRGFIDLGYEARNRAIIFRTDEKTVYMPAVDGSMLKHAPGEDTAVLMEIEYGPEFDAGDETQVAVWAENSVGMMIKTFFVSEASAFSEEIPFDGELRRRSEILPVWRHRYTLLSGVDPDGNLDGASGATPDHSFSIEQYLKADSSPFYLYFEINKPGDGQPSAIFGAYIEVKSAKDYYLLSLVGHGGDGSAMRGHMFYDLEKLTTARELIEKITVRVNRYWE